MRTRSKRILLGTIGLATLAMVIAGPGWSLWSWAAGPTQKEPPPKFDREVLDTFFEDARKQLGPGEPGLVRTAASATAATSADAGAPAAKTAAWSALVPAETLEAEVKSSVAPAADAIKNLAFFKGDGHKIARNTYTHLAVLFAVISQFDGDVRWKKDAVGLRHKFLEMAANCKTSSDATFNQAKLRSQDLTDIVGGQSVELPPNADPETPLGKDLYRPSMMARMEVMYNERLAPWTADQGAFNKNKADLLREAQVMAMLAKVLQDPAFEFADDAGYQGHAKMLEEQSKALIDAVKLDNQAGASSAASQISKACSACHGDFR